ncbi:hypothetical protein K2173_000471 [Erythroxylum novogranatense]|uniref:FAD-binding PCMH-type domain-containing protein n=1 Tax=Erythroxylum novogranatense TaxID=1862640 RepID=A0AAV8SXB4_9ROSI|nr:hypothetical protein K2173_000471 [Erythroxylum novogranatense]
MGAVPPSATDHELFYQSLLRYSHPSHPISKAIYTPHDHEFPSVLQAYIRNLRFNTPITPKPVLILTALHESHVQAAVKCGRKHGLQMKIRSGGHDYEGTSYVSEVPFFILDMCNLRSVEVDIDDGTAWVQAGATLGEVFYRIAEKSKTHGFPAGVCPTVGVGGHFVGGGYGSMMRKYGLTVDHIIDAKLVNADGKILDRDTMGEDMFWAIRGGGGSFGVVLAFKINIVRVPEKVTVFKVQRTLEENATDIVYQWQHAAPKIDEDLFIRLVLDVVRRGEGSEKTVRASFVALFLGDAKRLLSITEGSFPELGLVEADCLEMSWLESILFWDDFPAGTPKEAALCRKPQTHRQVYLKRKSDYVQEPISKQGLEGIWKKMIQLERPILAFNPYGGKMSEISPTSTPFPHRAGNLWKIQYQINWTEKGTEAADYYIDLGRQLYNYMTPFVSKNPRAAFVNYKDLDLGTNKHGTQSFVEGYGYGVRYFKQNFNRLVQIKTKVDPHNFFRHEQSIPTLPYQKL